MRRKHIPNPFPTSLKDVQKLVGQERLVQDEGREVFYPVTVRAVELDGCRLKAVVEVVHKTLGQTPQKFDICVGDLYTAETAEQWISNRLVQELIDRSLLLRAKSIVHQICQSECL